MYDVIFFITLPIRLTFDIVHGYPMITVYLQQSWGSQLEISN